MSVDFARYYASLNVPSILLITLPCTMEAFCIVSREGHLLSLEAWQLLQEIRTVAKDIY